MAKVFNPDMLLLARESRELNQSELATAAGVTQPYVSQLEHGEREPATDKLQRLAAVLAYPVEWFYQRDRYEGLGISGVFYRKRSKAQVGHLRKFQAEASIRQIQVTRMLRDFDLTFPQTFTRMDIDEHAGNAEQVAAFVRASWSLPIGPIRNLVNVIEAAGGLVFKFPFGSPDIDAMGRWPNESPPLFFINAEAPADRVRFSLAHELGHVVMHTSASETIEAEADRFAAEFLMPARDIGPQLGGMTVQKAAAMKPQWRTSMAALIRRSRDTGRLGQTEYLRLVRRMSTLGYRRVEPGPIAPEEPQLVPQLLKSYREEHGLSVAELASRACVSEAEFTDRYLPRPAGLRLAR